MVLRSYRDRASDRIWSQSPQGADAASFADVLPLARSILPEALIDDRGWERLAERARKLPPSAADAAFDLVEGRVAPGLGLELSRPGRTGGGWREALDLMSGEHWCLPGKAAALGLATRSERIFSRAGLSDLHCGVNHVKLGVAAPGRRGLASGECVASAKGYVACVLRPLS